ncbi:peptidylprolyl isomerase [Sphingobacterium endophyticum]|uniref:peptidylprolyl isomerase n=1 Tax=Sphingobacterium endophyticum TaxID=2546448 RepID=UPI00293BC0A1|nr:peptidylprolyl isomerase [Sphingobacterium endophyticum]
MDFRIRVTIDSMKNFSSLLIIILLACTFQAKSQEKLIDRVVATVGSGIILQSDVDMQYSQYLANGGTPTEDFKCTALQQLIMTKLLSQQAALDSIEVSESEIDDQLNARMREMTRRAGGKERLEGFLKRSLLQYKEEMRPVLSEQMKAEKFQNTIISKVTVTPQEVKKYFEGLNQDSLPAFNTEVEIGEIVVYPELTKEEKNVFRTKAEGFRQQVVDGTDFGTVARFYSEDPGSANQGGEYDFAPRENYVKEFSAMAFKLKPGELSPVFETEYGFHFLQVLERRGEEVKVRHVLVTSKPTQASLDRVKGKIDSIYDKVQSGKLPFSTAATLLSDNKETKFNGGMVINPQSSSRSTLIPVDLLEKEVFIAIDSLEAGQVSKPYQFQDPRSGKSGYKFTYLKTRIPPHKASLEQDFAKIQEAAQEDKTRRSLSEWFEKKTKNTFVHINSEFATCDELQMWITNDTNNLASSKED